MEGNELSYSEYLKCNNASVKVTINRYTGLCLETLRELRDAIPSLLQELEKHRPTNPHAEQGPWFDEFVDFMHLYCRLIDHCINFMLKQNADKWSELLLIFIQIFQFIHHFTNNMLNENVWGKGEKCEAIDLSSLTAVFRRIVYIQDLPSLTLHYKSLSKFMQLLREVVGRYDPKTPSLRFGRSLILHNFMFPEVIKAGKLLATFVLKQPHTILQKLFQFTEQGFEPKEIHNGSGTVIADNFVITNKHVTEDAVSDETLEVCIQNETIGELPCVVVHCDAANDLALLYCPGLDLKRHGICEFLLSKEKLYPSLPVFSFGYPLTHTGRSALFVNAYVSGFKERYGREPFVVLNCDLNHGNSGGPVFRRIDKEIKLVGVVAQKHKKETLTLKGIKILEEERSILQEEQINGAAESRDHFLRSLLLTLYDALNETHCQFGYGNVVPGHLVVEFLSDPTVASIMDFLKEMGLCTETDEFDAQE